MKTSSANPDPGYGCFLTTGSGIDIFRIPDLGSQTHISERIVSLLV
jgi:hypothetical protein